MEKPKLNPDDLDVTSFETDFYGPSISIGITTDPTAATRCYYCPPPTIGSTEATV